MLINLDKVLSEKPDKKLEIMYKIVYSTSVDYGEYETEGTCRRRHHFVSEGDIWRMLSWYVSTNLYSTSFKDK